MSDSTRGPGLSTRAKRRVEVEATEEQVYEALSTEPATLADVDQVHNELDHVWKEIHLRAQYHAESSVHEARRLSEVKEEAADAQSRIAWLWVVLCAFFIYEIVKLVILFA